MPRNVSGTYSLPLPPVVPNTVIQAAWANTTDDDLAQAITDSLDRNGRGGMIAPFRLVDGTPVQPAFAFNAETGTGIYRASAGVMGVSVMGVQVAQWSATEYSVATDFSVTGNFGVAGDIVIAGDILGTVHVTGGIAVDGGITSLDDVSSVQDFDGAAGFFATNVNAGTHAYAIYRATNNSAHSFGLAAVGTANTDFPANSDTGVLFSDHTQGISLVSTAAAGIIRFFTNGFGNERMRLTADGRLAIGSVGFAGIPFSARVGLNQTFGIFSLTAGTTIGCFTDAGSAAPLRIAAQVIVFSGDGGAHDQVTLAASGVITFGNGFVSGAGGNIAYSAPSSYAQLIIQNTSNTAGSHGRLYVSSAGSGGGGALVYFVRPGVFDWSVGLESSDSSWRVGVGTTLTASPAIIVNTSARVGIQRSPTFSIFEVQGTAGIADGDMLWRNTTGGDARFGYESFSSTGCFNLWTASAIGLNFGTSTAARMKITAGGLFGFGAMASVAGPTFQMDAEFGGQSVFRLTYTGGVQAYMQANAASDVRMGSLTGHPMIVTCNGTPRITVPVSTSAAVTHSMSGGDYTVTLDPGATAAAIPIGGFVFAQASGVTGAALSPGGAIALGGGVTLAWQAYSGGGGQTINTGTWRNIGAQTAGGAGMWMRVA